MAVDNKTVFGDIRLVPVPWDWRLILQLILAIVGIIGNSAVIHVYLHTRKLSKSATNRFVAALAVADLITSICLIPIPTLSYVPDNFGGHLYCKVVVSSVIMWISIIASMYSLIILALERFVAISRPARYKQIFSVENTRLMIIGIWVFGFAFNTFSLYITHLDNVNGACYIDFISTEFQIFIGLSAFCVEFVAPITFMLIPNILSIRLLNEKANVFATKSNKQDPNSSLLQARQRIINMLSAVIICFVICWTPDVFAITAMNLGFVPFEYLYGNLYQAFIVLAFANSCINPVIYTLTNKNFRQAINQYLFRLSVLRDESDKDPFDSPLEVRDNSSSSTNISLEGNNAIANNI